MIHRPVGIAAFEFVVVASQRASQLMSGCVPRVAPHSKPEVTAQLEVAAGKVRAVPSDTTTL